MNVVHPPEQSPTPHKPEQRLPRILVIEDEADIAEVVLEALSSRVMCEVQRVDTLRKARRELKRSEFDLVLVDLHLPDGDGMDLVARMRTLSPGTAALVMTGHATVDRTISSFRAGVVDVLPKPFTPDLLADRVKQALKHRNSVGKKDQRIAKLKNAVRKLSAARKTVNQKVDLLCNDLVSAYGELARQVELIRKQEHFRKLLDDAADLEQMLCHTMDYLLKHCGYCNIAIYLATDDAEDAQDLYELGAYMKYTRPGDAPLVEAINQGLLPVVLRDGFVRLNADAVAEVMPSENAVMIEGETVIADRCSYLGENLASIVLFRDGESPFSEEDCQTLQTIAPIFAVSLAGLVRRVDEDGNPIERPAAEAELEDDWDWDEKPKKKEKKTDEADWWKRGDEPPF